MKAFIFLLITFLNIAIIMAQPAILRQELIQTSPSVDPYVSNYVLPKGMSVNSVGEIRTYGEYETDITSPITLTDFYYRSYYRLDIPATSTIIGSTSDIPVEDMVAVGSSFYTLQYSSNTLIVTNVSMLINISGVQGIFIESDNAGNLIVVGKTLNSSVDINPDAGGISLISANAYFVATYTTSGLFINAFKVPGVIDQIQDDGLSIVIGGRFSGTVDFGGSNGVKTAQVGSDNFVARYSITNGNYGSLFWVNHLSDSNANNIFKIKSIAIDNLSGIVLCGDLNTGGSIDLDAGVGVVNKSSSGNFDIVLARYNSNGEYQSSFTLGDVSEQLAGSVKVDQAGNIFCVGSFKGTVDFNPDSNAEFLLSATVEPYNLNTPPGSHDFVLKLNSNGIFQWVHRADRYEYGYGLNLEIDSEQNLVYQARRYKRKLTWENQYYYIVQFIPYDYIMKFSQDPKIYSFSFSGNPINSVQNGMEIQINGVNFSPIPSENIVLFNNKPAVVTTSTMTRISVVVPQETVTSSQNVPVSVSVGGKTAWSNIWANPASQTITFSALSAKTYGDVTLTLSASASSGLPVSYGSSNPAVATVSGDMVTIVGAGTTTISASQSGGGGYSPATVVSRVFTVNKAPLIATAIDKSKIFGSTNPPLTISYSGFVLGESSSVINTQPSITTTAGTCSYVGTYPITLTGGSDNNYSISLMNGIMTVTKKTMTVTANSFSRAYNTANPTFTLAYTASNFTCGDRSSVINVAPSLSTTAIQSSDAGTYPITLSGGSDDNYSFAFVSGVLTITKANQTITFNTIPTKCALGVVSLPVSTSSGLPLSFSSSNTSVATGGSQVIITGNGSSSITASQGGDGNYYAATSVSKTLTVAFNNGFVQQSGDICTDGFVTLTAGSGTNYSWSTGATTQAITGGVGYYSVTYLANGCTNFADYEVLPCPPPECPDPYNPNCPCVGPNCARKRPETEQPVEFTTLGIFPNPVDEALMIHIEEPATTRLEIAMVSQFGSRVRGSAIEKGSSKANLDVKDLAEGMYIVTVLAETGYVLRQKVVVIHTQ